jgi:hypothetical protein
MNANPNARKPMPDASPATASRRLLYWIVLGLVALNIILFVKFGLVPSSKPAGGLPHPTTNPHLPTPPN